MTTISTKKSINHPFTLIEIFLCIAIVSMMSAFLGLKSYELLKASRYANGYKRIQNTIILCQKMASIENRDYTLLLRNDDRGMILEISGPRKEKKTIQGLHFSYGTKKNKMELGFASTGRCYPSGTLKVFSLDKSFIKVMDLEKETHVFDLKTEKGKSPPDPREIH